MSAKSCKATIKRTFVHEYEDEWEISGIISLNSKGIRTLTFFPLPGIDLAFCFELGHVSFTDWRGGDTRSLLNFYLVKQIGYDVSPTLRLAINLEVFHSDEKTFKKMTLSERLVNDTGYFKIGSVVIELVDRYIHSGSYHSNDTTHYRKLKSTDKLIIKCHMSFFDQLHDAKYFEELNTSDSYQEFSKNMSDIYSNTSNDIVFKINEKCLPAHKAILMAHSPVFMKMLNGNFSETANNCIVITDASYEAFEVFLKYLYSGEITEKSWPIVKDLYILADKYDVKLLKKKCVFAIKSCLSIDTVCDISAIAFACDDERLKRMANIFAATNIQELILKAEWKNLIVNHPLIGHEVMTIIVSNMDL